MFGFINTTLLWALAAIALPLLIHLLTRRKLRVVTVSTIAFLKRLEKEKIRQLKLRQLLLLLLRMLIVALLVLAFTRPTLRHEQSALAQRAAATAVVIIDNSLSMAAAPEGASLLAQARNQAQRLAEVFAPGDEIYLITAAKPARFVTATPLLSPERLAEMITSVPQSSGETDLAGALALAHEKLASSRNVNREIYVLSDGRAELPAKSESTPGQGESIRGLRNYVIRFDKTVASNLSLQAATLSNQIFERGKTFETVATIANNGQRDLNNRLVHLFLNGKRVAQQTVEVPAGSERRVSFRAVPDTTGFIFGRIELEDDDLLLDNVRGFTFFIPPQRRVLAASGTSDDLAFVRLAFDPVRQSGAASQAWREIASENFAAERFENYDGIVLANVPRLSETVAQRLINYLKNGGGVMIFLGSEVDLRNYNELLLSRLGAGAFGETMGQLAANGLVSTSDNVMKLGRIDFSHPVFSGIFEKSDKAPRLDSPLFRFAVQMRLGSGTTPIMEYANGYPFLVERRVGSGLMLIFTSAATEKWSDFAFKGLFAPLVHRCISYMTQSRDNQRESQFVGEELVTNLRVPAAAVEIELPGGDRRKAPVKVTGQNYQVRYAEVEQTGLYRLWQAAEDSLARAGKLLQAWAVNFNPVELKLPPLADQDWKSALGGNSVAFISPDVDILAAVRQARFGSELWLYFVVAAIIAMIVEMWLSRSAGQSQMGVGKSASRESTSIATPSQ
jgi:Mg-chelatase subunit ChlD